MKLFTSKSDFKKVFLHLDGDSFFAACEVALNPKLRGKPVVTGLEKGIASAMTYEAKARGVTRGMRLFEIRQICPDVVILPSDYETYSIFSQRMYNIVRRYAPRVEEYSIDECFADLTSVVERIYLKGGGLTEIRALAQRIKDDLQGELGITFSLGIGPTKVLAKMGSKQQKPNGLTIVTPDKVDEYLVKMPIGKIWGIGASTSVRLNKLGVNTAFEFTQKPEWWVKENLSKPYLELWNELKGVSINDINTGEDHVYKSISRTRMFKPPTMDKSYIFSELSKNIEHACMRARSYSLVTSEISYYIKTQDFRYHSCEVRLGENGNTPENIIQAVKRTFDGVFRPNTLYRASGVTLLRLQESGKIQTDLFGGAQKIDKMLELYKTVDHISALYGGDSVFLASSLRARQSDGRSEKLGQSSAGLKAGHLFAKGHKQLGIPIMGVVR